MLNLITDVAGLSVGNADDDRLVSGVTVILPDAPVVASVSVLGGAPGGRDLGCLEPDTAVDAVDAIVLSGGSGFGLDSASGVQAWLRSVGRGFAVGHMRVPVVPSAICFDLMNGGEKGWGRYPPYREMGFAACESARTGLFALGSVGAGMGASTVDLKGGLGSASARTSRGHTVGAIVAVNALGSAVVGGGPHFWAAALERDGEIGGLGLPRDDIAEAGQRLVWKGGAQTATTIACIATDATLTKAEAKRMAIAANDGFARALRITHAAMDGDTVFALSTRQQPLEGMQDLIELCAVGADCLSRAIARGVYEATIPSPRWAGPPAWRDRFGHLVRKG